MKLPRFTLGCKGGVNPLEHVQLATDGLDNVLLEVVRPHVVVLARLGTKSNVLKDRLRSVSRTAQVI